MLGPRGVRADLDRSNQRCRRSPTAKNLKKKVYLKILFFLILVFEKSKNNKTKFVTII